MSELVDTLRQEFQNEDYRHAYAEECVNTMIATQIRVLREEREMSQSGLANKAGMAQPRLSVMESADYSNWSVNTLKRLARAFDLALSVRFESFSEVILEFKEMSKENLSRPSFKDDPIFKSNKVRPIRRFRKKRQLAQDQPITEALQMKLKFFGDVIQFPDPISKDNSTYLPPTKKREDEDGIRRGFAG
jgi:transcriptional regulator with XRE-family HTH domain